MALYKKDAVCCHILFMSYYIFLVLYDILQKNRLYCIIWQCYVLWKMLFDCSLSCLDCVFFKCDMLYFVLL